MQLAEDVLAELLAAGFDKATSRVSQVELHELQAENGELALFRTNFETDVGLSGIRDQRRASISVNNTAADTLKGAVAELGQMADAANADAAFDIAEAQPPETFERGDESPDYDAMYARLTELLGHVEKAHPSVILRSAAITFVHSRAALRNSNSVAFDTRRGLYRVSVGFSARQSGQTSSMNYLGYATRALEQPVHTMMNIDEYLRQATEQTDTSALPGKFNGQLIIAPTCTGSFLSFLTSRLSDGALVSGTSVFADKLGQQVTSPLLTLRSTPRSPVLASGYWLTGDGYVAEDSVIVDNGLLQGFLLGIYGANKTGHPRAVNSGGSYQIDAGHEQYAEMIAAVDEGVLINRFSGGRPNDRGDFSGVAKNSYYIRDGKICHPLKETTVSGNLVDLLQDIRGVSRERLNSGGSQFPWLRVGGITVS